MKTIWQMIKRLLLLAVIVFLPVVVAIIVLTVKEIDTAHDLFKEELWNSGIVPWMLLLGEVLAIVFFFGKKYVSASLGSIRPQDFWPMIGMALLLCIGWSIPETFLQNWIQLPDTLSEEEFNRIAGGIAGTLSVCLTGPIVEEIAFRGILQGSLQKAIRSPWVAIALSAIAFGLFHENPVQIVYGTVWGVLIGWLFWKTGSLIPGMAVHIFNNSSAMLIPENIWDKLEGVSPALQITISLVCMGFLAIGIRWFNRR